MLYLVPIPTTDLSPDEHFNFRFNQLRIRQTNHVSAEITTSLQRHQQKLQFDKKYGTTEPLHKNDLVLLWDQPFTTIKTNKLKQPWSGPYRVVSETNTVFYLKDLAGTQLRIPFPRHRLNLFFPRESSLFLHPPEAVAHFPSIKRNTEQSK